MEMNPTEGICLVEFQLSLMITCANDPHKDFRPATFRDSDSPIQQGLTNPVALLYLFLWQLVVELLFLLVFVSDHWLASV